MCTSICFSACESESKWDAELFWCGEELSHFYVFLIWSNYLNFFSMSDYKLKVILFQIDSLMVLTTVWTIFSQHYGWELISVLPVLSTCLYKSRLEWKCWLSASNNLTDCPFFFFISAPATFFKFFCTLKLWRETREDAQSSGCVRHRNGEVEIKIIFCWLIHLMITEFSLAVAMVTTNKKEVELLQSWAGPTIPQSLP